MSAQVSLRDHRIMNSRHGQVACFCDVDWMTLDEYGDHIEHVAAIVEREHREAEWELIDAAGITWQSRARRLAARLREANIETAGVNDGQVTHLPADGADAAPDESKGAAAPTATMHPAPAVIPRCSCGADATSLNPAEVVVHRPDGPCYIAPARRTSPVKRGNA